MTEQLTLDHTIARAEADAGMRRSLEHAEAECAGWGGRALRWLRFYAETHAEFPGWFVTQEAERDPGFPTPATPKAWGAVWTKATRLGIVRDTGKTMKHPRRHNCKAIVWRSLVFRAA